MDKIDSIVSSHCSFLFWQYFVCCLLSLLAHNASEKPSLQIRVLKSKVISTHTLPWLWLGRMPASGGRMPRPGFPAWNWLNKFVNKWPLRSLSFLQSFRDCLGLNRGSADPSPLPPPAPPPFPAPAYCIFTSHSCALGTPPWPRIGSKRGRSGPPLGWYLYQWEAPWLLTDVCRSSNSNECNPDLSAERRGL